MSYRTTPLSFVFSLAKLMFGQALRSTLRKSRSLTLSPTWKDPSHMAGPASARSFSEDPEEDVVQHKKIQNVYIRSGRQVRTVQKSNMFYYQ